MKGGRLLFILIMAFVIVISLAYFLLFEHGWSEKNGAIKKQKAPQETQIEPSKEQETYSNVKLSLEKLKGKVEIKHENGVWQSARKGEILDAKDRIRTDKSARAWLSMPDIFSVELDASSEFEIGTLTKNVFKFLLEKGMIFADVIDNKNHLFEVKSSTTTAKTRGASFQMITNSEGNVSLGTSRGSVDVEEAGKTIRLKKGYLTRIIKGRGPQDPIKIPPGLFLKVRWPRENKLSSSNLQIAGHTSPNARVRVNDVIVFVDSKGNFRKNIKLNEGTNRIQVDSYDLGGRRKTILSPKYWVDTRPETFLIETSPEMWEKEKKKNTQEKGDSQKP